MERIILAPGANGTELTKTMALRGCQSYNLRIFNGVELADEALLRSGIILEESLLTPVQENNLVAEALKGITYFPSSSYGDVERVAAALRSLRKQAGAGQEPELIKAALGRGSFKAKNAALLKVYYNYMDLLKAQKALDGISLMRRALQEALPLADNTELLLLEEYPVSPLEQALVQQLIGNFKAIRTIKLEELMKLSSQPIVLDQLKSCYGAPNEVENVIDQVYRAGNLDQCTIALADVRTYSQLFLDYALLYNLPVTFGCGLPISNANPAKLLKQYATWASQLFDGEVLVAMLESSCFKSSALWTALSPLPENFSYHAFLDILKSLRLTNNSSVNAALLANFEAGINYEDPLIAVGTKDRSKFEARKKSLPVLKQLAHELELNLEDFLYKYSYLRQEQGSSTPKLLAKLDLAARSCIYETIQLMQQGNNPTIEDILAQVQQRMLCPQRFEEGKLHITSIKGALTALRDKIYIVGLSSANYPGKPVENPLLLDEDLRSFGPASEYITSTGQNHTKKAQLLSLVKLASAAHCQVNLSYSGLDVAELKDQNPSSLLFELYRLEQGATASIGAFKNRLQQVAYFEPAISRNREIGNKYNEGKQIFPYSSSTSISALPASSSVVPQNSPATVPVSRLLDRAYSPSALEKFFQCPRHFFYASVLGLSENDKRELFQVINPAEEGTLAHLMMDQLVENSQNNKNEKMAQDEFLKLVSNSFDNFLREHPVINSGAVPKAKAEFMDMMKSAYDNYKVKPAPIKEVDISALHPCGIKLHGFPDCVEEVNGSYVVVDYKTSRQVKHTQDDIISCLQVVIYAFLLESLGYKVDHGEFRYIRLGAQVITCKYDDAMKKELDEKLKSFKQALEHSDFPIISSKDNCQYCKMGDLCGRKWRE